MRGQQGLGATRIKELIHDTGRCFPPIDAEREI